MKELGYQTNRLKKNAFMEDQKIRIAVFIWSLVFSSGIFAGDVSNVKIEKTASGYTVIASSYIALLDTTGALSSLRITGTEFLSPLRNTGFNNQKIICPTIYACPMNLWNNPQPLKQITAQTGNTIRADGDRWWLEYTFLPDAIEFNYQGTPGGGRSFTQGYPPAELVIGFSPELDRACDVAKQGDLGWPVARTHDPGDFAILAKNGAGVVAENASLLSSINGKELIPDSPHRLDQLVFYTYVVNNKPLKRRLRILTQPAPEYSVKVEILPSKPGHIFSGDDTVTLPVKISALYGHNFKGKVGFEGAPYVWKQPVIKSEIPIIINSDAPEQTVQFTIRPDKPGHYIGKIYVGDENRTLNAKQVGFLFHPENIPAVTPPPDFDAFWDNTLAELQKIPLDLTLEEQKEKATPLGKVYKAKFRSWGGRWAWAWLYVPAKEGKVAGLVRCPPVSVWQPGQAKKAGDSLIIAASVHGGDISDCPAKPDFDYMNTNIASRDDYMLRYSYCCIVRCFDIISNYEKCNGEVSVEGSSQGGGLSLVLAGIRPVKHVRIVVPALCRIDWTILGYTQWGPQCPKGEDPKKIADNVRYYDPGCFAHRIRAPLKLGFALFDHCAPAEAIYTALNALPRNVPCEIFVDPYGGHASFDYITFNKGETMLEAPRWYGSAKENKLRE